MTASQTPPDELDKLFACLVRVVRDRRPESLASPFTVSDLLAFVPYKTVRAEIGTVTDDDYGQAMTQLLAGERGLLFVDDLMQDDMRAELASKNPDLQAYRSYLNTLVTLAPERVRDVLDSLGPGASRPGCKFCGQPLPLGRELRFCPHCGQDLSVHRCGACSTELEPGWKFCVSCGRAANA